MVVELLSRIRSLAVPKAKQNYISVGKACTEMRMDSVSMQIAADAANAQAEALVRKLEVPILNFG